MKHFYPSQGVKVFFRSIKQATLTVTILSVGVSSFSQISIPELVFKNPTLMSGSTGQNGAIYKFANVAPGIDAQVKINGRSSNNVVLTDIDITSTGYGNAFQPLVNYTGGGNLGSNMVTDWYIEFQVSFVQAGTSTPITASGFDVSGLDDDGNSALHEYLSFYNLNTYTLENPTALTVTNITSDTTTIGKRYDGSATEYDGIDVNASKARVTSHYINTSSFLLRVGGKAKGPVSISNNGRQYSLWFKSFSYANLVKSSFQVSLSSFTAQLNNKKVMLGWVTAVEVNTSHFVIQRSLDGESFDDDAIVFTEGNSSVHKEYSFADNIASINEGLIYYRLKMVDLDAKYRYSDIVVVRLVNDQQQTNILAYSNPAINELRGNDTR